MKAKMGVGLVLFTLVLSLVSAQSVSQAIWGTVTACGSLATDGTITASSGDFSHSIAIAADGTFGGAGVNDQKLVAQTNTSSDTYNLSVSDISGCGSTSTVARNMNSTPVLELNLDFGGTASSSSSSTSGGGSSGGGSGGSSSSGGGASGFEGTSNVIASKAAFWSSVSGGGSVTMPVDVPEIAISAIRITFAENVENVRITVKALRSRPGEVSGSPADKVYQYLEIEVSNAEDSKIAKVEIDFKTPNAWMRQNDVLKDNVFLYRYVSPRWNELLTTTDGEDTTYTYYTSESPGLSYFAVAAQATPDTSAPEVTPSDLEPEETEEEIITQQKKSLLWVFILFGLVIVGLIVYVVSRKK